MPRLSPSQAGGGDAVWALQRVQAPPRAPLLPLQALRPPVRPMVSGGGSSSGNGSENDPENSKMRLRGLFMLDQPSNIGVTGGGGGLANG